MSAAFVWRRPARALFDRGCDRLRVPPLERTPAARLTIDVQ